MSEDGGRAGRSWRESGASTKVPLVLNENPTGEYHYKCDQGASATWTGAQ